MNIGLPPNPEDFRSRLEKLAPLSPDAIFLPVYYPDFVKFLSQLREDPALKTP